LGPLAGVISTRELSNLIVDIFTCVVFPSRWSVVDRVFFVLRGWWFMAPWCFNYLQIKGKSNI